MLQTVVDLPWWAPVALCAAALLAGWVDAVVGGGGLIQLPALLLIPGFTPVQAIATNKVGSIMGTITSSVTYARRIRPSPRIVAPTALVALAGSFAGGVAATHVPASVFTPIIIIALVGVLVFTLARPDVGTVEGTPALPIRVVLARAVPFGALVGFYDGIMGPGTGSFLVVGLALLAHLSFLHATAISKIVNVATNLGALLFFVPQGLVDWPLGLMIGLANTVGGYIGARTTLRFGSRFVRGVLIVVVSALILRLAVQTIQG